MGRSDHALDMEKRRRWRQRFKKKHGGLRAGAGRKTLSRLERWRIGARAEEVYRSDRTPIEHPDVAYPELRASQKALRERRGGSADLAWVRKNSTASLVCVR